MKDTNSLSHTSYRCKYHIVIVPKYRRLIIYNKLRRDIIEILVLLVNRFKDVELIEEQACPDHIHMLLEIPPKYSISEFMGRLKSKLTLIIFDIFKYDDVRGNVQLYPKYYKYVLEQNQIIDRRFMIIKIMNFTNFKK